MDKKDYDEIIKIIEDGATKEQLANTYLKVATLTFKLKHPGLKLEENKFNLGLKEYVKKCINEIGENKHAKK